MLGKIILVKFFWAVVAAVATGLLIKFAVPQRWRFRVTLGLIAVAVLTFLFTFIRVNHQLGGVSTVYTADMEPIDILLDGKVSLRIPKAYLTDPQNWHGGVQDTVNIEATLPDLKPVGLTQDQSESKKVWIYLSEGSENRVGPTRQAMEQFKNTTKYLEDSGYKIGKLSEEGKMALNNGFFKQYDYFLTITPDNRQIKFVCEKGSPRCQNWTTFDGKILGSYIVDKALVPAHWKAIDDKIVRLVDGFAVVEGQSK